ncbi:uncharacterized protein LOC129591747 [Paramacrobiotus metropolitanus]|uniref:uncharacterized protein LOC129591747 n=1 Tax=Paramacrobiotus metropolitanus TaxID=2943436 RepID=UPI0024462BA6|nr:uncharacterized protein LOC129591747 [Paramacrobiotus metropolitanus]
MEPEAAHWSAILPIYCLKRLPLSLYRSICHADFFDGAVKSILQNHKDCAEEKKLLSDLTRIERLITHSLLLAENSDNARAPLSLLDHIVNQCSKQFCQHDHFFLERYYVHLLNKNQAKTYKKIRDVFDRMYEPSIQGIFGETINFPLPANYIPRISVLREVQAAMRQKLPSRLFQSGCTQCIVIAGNSRCGKTAVLANVLRDIQLREIFASITAVKFGEDEDVDGLMDDTLADAKRQKLSRIESHLLVLDNLMDASAVAVKHMDSLAQFYKCIIITTRAWKCEPKSQRCKYSAADIGSGFTIAESTAFFCSMFDCKSEELPIPLLNTINQIHEYCQGCPLRQRIIYTMARKTHNLSCQPQDFGRWRQFFQNLKNPSVSSTRERGTSIDQDDSGWALLPTPTPTTSSSPRSDSESEAEYDVIEMQPTAQFQAAEFPLEYHGAVCTTGVNFSRTPKRIQLESSTKKPSRDIFGNLITRGKLFPPTKPTQKRSTKRWDHIAPQMVELHTHGTFRYSLTEKYRLKVPYGRSSIYTGHCVERKCPVAIKKTVWSNQEQRAIDVAVKKVQIEFNIVANLNHGSILRYYDLAVQLVDRQILLFMEHCNGGCLKKVIERGSSLPKVKSYLMQILDGVNYLHQRRIFHLDLKTENIFLAKDDHIKIGDFGEVFSPDSSDCLLFDGDMRGTGHYMSPEMICQNGTSLSEIGRPSDIWSFGCIALELLTQHAPSYRKTCPGGEIIELQLQEAIWYYIAATPGSRPYIPESLDVLASDFVQYCFKRDYALRPSAAELLTHQFLLHPRQSAPILRLGTCLYMSRRCTLPRTASLSEMAHHEALHWSTALPIQSLRKLPCSLYKKMSDRFDLTIVIESVLQSQDCEKEQTLCIDVQNLEKLSKTPYIRLALSSLDHFITHTIATGKTKEFCEHSVHFFNRYLNALLERSHTELFKDIIAAFDGMVRPHLIRALSGQAADFPLPPNYVPRIALVNHATHLVSKALKIRKASTLSAAGGTWVVISGEGSCGKTAVLANVLRTIQVEDAGRLDHITAEKFDEDSNIEEELKRIAAQNRRTPASPLACNLLVLDNVFQWNKEASKQAELLSTFYKCVIVTTRDTDLAKKLKTHVEAVSVPEGFNVDESIAFFCSVFKCNEKEIPTELKMIIKKMHAYTNGSPLKLRIILTTAWRTLKLTAKGRDLPRWRQYLDTLKYSTGASSFEGGEGLLERAVDDDWLLVDQTPSTSPTPSAAVRSKPVFDVRKFLPVKGAKTMRSRQRRDTKSPVRQQEIDDEDFYDVEPSDIRPLHGTSIRAKEEGPSYQVGGGMPRMVRHSLERTPSSAEYSPERVQLREDGIRDSTPSSAEESLRLQPDGIPSMPSVAAAPRGLLMNFQPALTPFNFQMSFPQAGALDSHLQVEELESALTFRPPTIPCAIEKEPSLRRKSLPSGPPPKLTYSCSFDEQNCLGAGRSKVYRATRKDNGQPIAVKRIEVAAHDDHDQEVESVYKEFKVVSRLNHQNILKYYDMDVKADDRIILLLMELCDGGSLKSAAKTRLSLSQTQGYLTQLLDGLQYLHAQKIYHLDLKGENVFLTSDGLVKIGDFGEMASLERSFSGPEDNAFVANIGTVMYMSPEMIRGDDVAVIGQPSDVWSFGCVALELLTGRTPRYQKQQRDGSVSPLSEPMPIMFFVGSGGRPHIPEDLDSVAVEFLEQCFKRDITKRWSAEQLRGHGFLTYQVPATGGHRNYSPPPEIIITFQPSGSVKQSATA